jgi:hypothetical protein
MILALRIETIWSGFLWEMAAAPGKDFSNLKTCDNMNSDVSSEPVLSDSLSQVLKTM